MSVVISDTFSGIAGTTLVGRTPDTTDLPANLWAVPAGAWKVDGTTHATTNGTTGSNQIASIDASAAPQLVQADIVVPATSQFASGIFLRYTDANNLWVLAIKNDTGGAAAYRIDLIKRVAGVETPTTLESGLTLGGTTQTLLVSMDLVNNVFTCKRNGSASGSPVTDSGGFNSTSHVCGLLSFSNGFYQPAKYTNFSVQLNPAIIPTTLPNPVVGVGYSQTLTALGASGSTSFSVTTGILPTGLTLSAGGILSGAVTGGGTASFTVSVFDVFSDTGTQAYTLAISGKPALVTPDPRASPRTRRFQQGVAAILNGLTTSGYITMTSGGGFKVGGIAIGDKVNGGTYTAPPVGGDVLFVGPGAVLAQDDNLTWDGTSGTLLANNLTARFIITCQNVSLTDNAGNSVGAFQAQVDVGGGFWIDWANVTPPNDYPAHFFTMATGSTAAATVGIEGDGSRPILLCTNDDAPPFTNLFLVDASGNISNVGTATHMSTSASALAVGRQGATNPVLQVDASAATVVTGLKIRGAASGGGVAIAAISSAAAENLTLDALTTGTITLGSVSSGNIQLERATVVAVQSSSAFTVRRGVATNPALSVDTNTASSVTGINIKAAASGGGCAVSVISSATNEALTVDAKGTGTITFGGTSTGNVAMNRNTTVAGTLTVTSTSAAAFSVGANGATNPGLQVDCSTASCVTGWKITSKAAGNGVVITATSSAGSEDIFIDALGSGITHVGTTAGSTLIGNSSNPTTLQGSNNVVTSVSSNALAVGANGTTNPALRVQATPITVATGLNIKATGAGTGIQLSALSSGTNEDFYIDGKGSGTIWLNNNSGTGSVAIHGTSTNDSAAAGNVGEEIQSLVALGSAVGLTNVTPANITSISLTAGDWDVEGSVNFTMAAATFTQTEAGISSTSATLPSDGSEVYSGLQGTTLTLKDSITLPRKRVSLASTTTVYLVAQAAFSAGTVSGYGAITARRVR